MKCLLSLLTLLSTFCLPTQSTVDDDNENNCPEGYGYIGGECMKKFVKPKFVQCPEPSIKFGSYELQVDGRVVEYWCEDGWTLVPEDFTSAVCILGAWSNVVPQCVRPGCDELVPENNVVPEYSYEGALVTFHCNNKNLILSGEPVLGCDGQYWNGTVPQCVLPTSGGTTSFKSASYLLLLVTSVIIFLNQICIPISSI